MKRLLINASPKTGQSASRCLMEIMQTELGDGTKQIELHDGHLPPEAAGRFAAAEQWVFFFPLYVDALPSHLLSCLEELAAAKDDLGPAAVYGVVNCGFYEGEQARFALEVLSNWAASSGFHYGGGIGIGGGGAIRSLPKTPTGPMGPAVQQLSALADRLHRRNSDPKTAYVAPAFPRFLYKAAGEASWRHELRQNGGRRKDLGNQPDLEP